MAKDITLDDKARQTLKKGVDKLTQAVRITLGPKGSNVILDRGFGSPVITNDGVTIAKEVEIEDKTENLGAEVIKQAAEKTSDIAGDGTTTAIVLAWSMINIGLKNVTAGANPLSIKKGIDKTVKIVVKELKKRTNVVVPEIKTKEKEVDTILVNYAKEKKLRLMTLDFNLNKVAKVSGISVLNLNDLVNALKTVLLPGERFKVKIAQAGKEKKQGIGYLNDGTMVVIENGIEKVGEEVEAVVIKVIQSSAGKIIFSEVAKNGNSIGDSAVEDKK